MSRIALAICCMAREFRYFTGVCSLSERAVAAELPLWRSLTGAGFRLEFRPLRVSGPVAKESKRLPRRFRDVHRPPEIQIVARSQSRADIAAQLLYAANALIDGCVPSHAMGWDPFRAKPAAGDAADLEGDARGLQVLRVQTPSAVDMAGLAVRLSRQKRLTEAGFFFLASVYLVSVEPMILRSDRAEAALHHLQVPMHRVWEAMSLFAGFQAIEALRLTVIGAGSSRPSVRHGRWDSEIRADLEGRLVKVGISPADRFIWHARGRPSLIHRHLDRRTSDARRAAWSQGSVQDREMPYIDAINRAQWLRSNVAAHQAGHLGKLRLIDVLNVQHLARVLVMSAARFPWWSAR